MRRALFCLLVLLPVLLAGQARAAIRPADAAATHRYLLAKIALERTGSLTAALGVLHDLAGQYERECPGILAGTPLGSPEGDTRGTGEKADGELGQELTGAVLGAPEHSERASFARFYAQVAKLRWSSRKLTHLLRSLALESERQSAIPAPDLCGDLRFWAASGYTGVTAATERYVHALDVASSTATIELGPGESGLLFDAEAVVARRLRRYEDPADRRLARRAFSPHPALSDPAVRPFIEAIEHVYSALGRSATP